MENNQQKNDIASLLAQVAEIRDKRREACQASSDFHDQMKHQDKTWCELRRQYDEAYRAMSESGAALRAREREFEQSKQWREVHNTYTLLQHQFDSIRATLYEG